MSTLFYVDTSFTTIDQRESAWFIDRLRYARHRVALFLADKFVGGRLPCTQKAHLVWFHGAWFFGYGWMSSFMATAQGGKPGFQGWQTVIVIAASHSFMRMVT